MGNSRVWCAFVAVLPFIAISQPVIDLSSAPSPGHSWEIHEMQWFDMLATGPNSTWDLSAAMLGTTVQLELAEPNTAPGASNFPAATVVAFANNGPPYNFLQVANGELRMLGGMTTSAVVYSDPLVSMVFPCTYGTTWTDSYAFPGEQGTHTYNADGFGSLIGPAWSLQDILKIRREYSTLDTVINGTHYQDLFEDNSFWHNSTPWPVATATWYRLLIDGQVIQEQRVGSIMAELPTGLPQAVAAGPQVKIWPNPTIGPITIRADRSGHYLMTCMDVSGKVLIQERVWVMADEDFTLSLGLLSPGLYMVHLAEDGGVGVTVQLIKD